MLRIFDELLHTALGTVGHEAWCEQKNIGKNLTKWVQYQCGRVGQIFFISLQFDFMHTYHIFTVVYILFLHFNIYHAMYSPLYYFYDNVVGPICTFRLIEQVI